MDIIMKFTILLVAFWLFSHSLVESIQNLDKNVEIIENLSDVEIDLAASESVALTSSSHKIMASGWPMTSPMWPSIETAEDPTIAGSAESSKSWWPDMIEPFIYEDKPRPTDYSLLLVINKTTLETLKSYQKPISVILTFEYYFNHGLKVTATPGIKIEIDRKQFKYLEPETGATTGENVLPIKARVWNKFNAQIQVVDGKQLENHDWLKFSLVNRQSPSLVAIRKLTVQFMLNASNSSSPTPLEPQPPAIQQPQAMTPIDSQSPPAPDLNQISQQLPPQQVPRVVPANPVEYQPASIDPNAQPIPQASKLSGQKVPAPTTNGNSATNSNDDLTPAASNALMSTIKPVKPKTSSWNPFGKRKKRQTPQTEEIATDVFVFTCYRRDSCQWKHSDGEEEIQWSLARMPPSTNSVQSGYFYNSNRNNYGNSANLLRLYLNQTDSATIADQNSDHCIELALYVTEKTHLKLYRMTRTSETSTSLDSEVSWTKGNQILNWAPTMSIGSAISSSETQINSNYTIRDSLNITRLPAMENGQNGWTFETLCFGDFFANPKECGSGKCAFGFEMETPGLDPSVSAEQRAQQDSNTSGPDSTKVADISERYTEQVVGVSLLGEFTLNVPQRSSRSKWLETWKREEVEPGDSWKFYPKLDVQVGRDNISLLNLYDESHYFIQSDWLEMDANLNFTGILAIEFNQTISPDNSTATNLPIIHISEVLTSNGEPRVFAMKLMTRLVDSKFDSIYSMNSTIEWSIRDNTTLAQFNLDFPVTEHLKYNKPIDNNNNLFKIILELELDCKMASDGLVARELLRSNTIFKFSLANLSLSDRCFPNPCQFGTCQQNGTGLEDWNCQCDERHRGRRCEFGRWCQIPHVTPWTPPVTPAAPSNGAQLQTNGGKGSTLRSMVVQPPPRQAKLSVESVTRVSGKEYCLRKMGQGSKCTEIDTPLNDNLYTEDDKTFTCSCQDDYYLSDDAKCKQAHLCNSIICPSIGMICDESKAFNRTQPCSCNEKRDWYHDPSDPNKCVRHQCHDKQRDCGFDAHICLPTLPGEKPICKCGPKFALRRNEKGQQYCESTACILPTLNDCRHICLPDNTNLEHPYTCSCHPGYQLEPDGRSCRPLKPEAHCRPGCHHETQICTDFGCKCRQGYLGESEIVVRQAPRRQTGNLTQIDYVQSVRCLNVCSLSYAENKSEFEMIESVCPLGLCDTSTFQCKCFDSSGSSLLNTKYEPIYDSSSTTIADASEKRRVSPLCHLRRVCEPESINYKICRGQGAICVPDYTKPAMFDCICPPSTEKRLFGQGTSSEFTCEPKCSSLKYECLRRQATCRPIDKDQVRCDCLPGLMFDTQEHKCYLARHSYSMNLILVNRYYEPESKFHRRLVESGANSTGVLSSKGADTSHLYEGNQSIDENLLNEIVPQFNKLSLSQPLSARSMFIADYNQCNISQVIPKCIIEDPYEQDLESYFSYIDQCNEKLHQNTRTYHLNSRLAEDLRQSLRQHLRDFTVTTSNSTCSETDSSGMYLNCTIYLQSQEPIQVSTIEHVFENCDKNGQDERFCWVKPRLLLRRPNNNLQVKSRDQNVALSFKDQVNFRQVVACDIDNFCGSDAISVRLDDETSLCSCKCPPDIEVVDVKDLESKSRFNSAHNGKLDEHDYSQSSRMAIKEICAPRNHCGLNSTFCLGKTGSICSYDVRRGSHCQCVYPSYENDLGHCVEVAYSQLDNSFIVIIIMLGTGLIVSIAINLYALAKSQRLFSHHKQYPLNDFPSSGATTPTARPMNRSTGVPNLGFDND